MTGAIWVQWAHCHDQETSLSLSELHAILLYPAGRDEKRKWLYLLGCYMKITYCRMEVLPYCRSKMYLVRMWGSHHACFPFFLWLTHKQVWMRFMNQAWKLVLFMSVCAQEHWEQCIIDLEGITAKFKSGGVFTFYLSSAGVSQRLGMPRDSTWCAATLCFLLLLTAWLVTHGQRKKNKERRERI